MQYTLAVGHRIAEAGQPVEEGEHLIEKEDIAPHGRDKGQKTPERFFGITSAGPTSQTWPYAQHGSSGRR